MGHALVQCRIEGDLGKVHIGFYHRLAGQSKVEFVVTLLSVHGGTGSTNAAPASSTAYELETSEFHRLHNGQGLWYIVPLAHDIDGDGVGALWQNGPVTGGHLLNALFRGFCGCCVWHICISSWKKRL
jgi:hypothetical protein